MPDQDWKETETAQHDVSSTASTMIDTSSTEDFQKGSHTPESRTTHSFCSAHHSIRSEPLSLLELALTTNPLNNTERLGHTYTKPIASLATSGCRIPPFEVDLVVDDPEDPRN
ncbi:hypothetical protein LSUB1_G007760 [Lachnellula subtilissima]|uniref:Uncharacterized protein n=1 Tax=Lachnellula subtilissima TaxID=602034 RepID=A0A8H8U838_9HELO|nr:hypothetical protein LSUB1_G007760 [Lachnellula subtilissima]